MVKNIALHVIFAAFTLLGAPGVQASEPVAESALVRLGADYGEAPAVPNVIGASPAALTEIARWLSDNYGLTTIAEHPRIEFVQSRMLAAMRYKNLLGPQEKNAETSALGTYQREVLAVYDDSKRTIFLPDTWMGKTPAEMSILVHEMVHHLQNVGQLKYECPAAREKPAYLAQDRWLTQHGLDLEQEFEIDKFTLVVNSACMG